jgi:hypothetical protein
MGTRRRACSRPAAAALALLAGAAAAAAHPSDEAIARDREVARLCRALPEGETAADPGRLGMSEAELRAAWGERTPVSAPERGAGEGGTIRLVFAPESGAIERVAYELWEGRVYRVRWRLAARFERPVFPALAARMETCLGTPRADQTFEAEPGSPDATLRRVEWREHGRVIELRQLHPLTGGPVFVTATDEARLRALGAAGGRPFPEPTRSGPWWERARPPEPATPDEAAALADALLGLLPLLHPAEASR